MASEGLNEIAKALAAAQAEGLVAIKDSTNPHLKNRYASLAACLEIACKVLPKHGLAVIQRCERSADQGTVLVTMLVHESGQWVESDIPIAPLVGNGNNPAQQWGSALTYAKRYGLTSLLGMAADEDDDGNSSGAGGSSARTIKQPQSLGGQAGTQNTPTSPPAPAKHPQTVKETKIVQVLEEALGEPVEVVEDPERPDTSKCATVVGVVEDVEVKSGEKAGKTWTRYGIKVGGKFYGTFSQTLGERAQQAKDDGVRVRLFHQAKGKYVEAIWLDPLGDLQE